MKRFLNLLVLAFMAMAIPTLAHAGSPRDLTMKSIFEFPLGAPTPAAGDYTLYWDNSARSFYRIDASQSAVITRSGAGTVVSGQTSIGITVTGVTASSRCQATQSNVATNSVYIRAAVVTTNTVTVTLSADPGVSNQNVSVLCVN